MSHIIRRAEYAEELSYSLVFEFVGSPGFGFVFPCDARGEVGPLLPTGQSNYDRCMANTHDKAIVCKGIEEHRQRLRIAALLQCDCGESLALEDPMTNRCHCGQFYNGSGQALCDPSLWGEETGERFDRDGHQIL